MSDKKKPTKPAAKDRHKKRVMVSITEELAVAMERLARARQRSLSGEVREACFEYLEKRGVKVAGTD